MIKPIKKRIPLPPRRPADLGSAPKPATAAPQQSPFNDVPAPAVNPAFTPTPLAPVTTPPALPPVTIIKPQPVKAPPKILSREETLIRINESLNDMREFSAKFSQVSGNGQLASGVLSVARPGRLRFDYNAPNTITIIADGNSVAILDSKLKTQDVYSIGLTPLKFLLRSTIDLASDTKLLDLKTVADRVWATVEDKSTFGGSSTISLGFDAKTLQLRQWTVTDPQGYEVQVMLSAINTEDAVDQSLFIIPSQDRPATKR